MALGICSLLAIIVFLLIGRYRLKKNALIPSEQINFLEDYRKKFLEFAEHYFRDDAAFKREALDYKSYEWLTRNADCAQEIIYCYVANYRSINSVLFQFRNGFPTNPEISSVDAMLLRTLGQLSNEQTIEFKHLNNPFNWFPTGIQVFLTGIGVLKESTSEQIISKRPLKVLLNVIGLLSAIITIVTGWEPLMKSVHSFFIK